MAHRPQPRQPRRRQHLTKEFNEADEGGCNFKKRFPLHTVIVGQCCTAHPADRERLSVSRSLRSSKFISDQTCRQLLLPPCRASNTQASTAVRIISRSSTFTATARLLRMQVWCECGRSGGRALGAAPRRLRPSADSQERQGVYLQLGCAAQVHGGAGAAGATPTAALSSVRLIEGPQHCAAFSRHTASWIRTSTFSREPRHWAFFQLAAQCMPTAAPQRFVRSRVVARRQQPWLRDRHFMPCMPANAPVCMALVPAERWCSKPRCAASAA